MLWRLMCIVKSKSCVPCQIYSFTGNLKCKLYKNAPKLARNVSTNVIRLQDKSQSTGHNEKDNDFITIYSEPAIKYYALFNKSIWLPSVVLVTALPVSTLLYVSGFIAMEQYISTAFLAIWFLSVIHLFAVNFWRKVGFLYVNKNMDKLKISYISYWGARKDIIIPVSEVMTFSDTPRSPFDFFYRKIKTFNSKVLEFNSYKLDLRSATIIKPDIFYEIFGSE